MQMQISCNRPNNLELCSICEMNINVPSAELRPLASLQEQKNRYKNGSHCIPSASEL